MASTPTREIRNPGRRTRWRRGLARWRRGLLWVAAGAVAVLVGVWWAGGSIAASLLEQRLRAAGWVDARVAGGSLTLPEVMFDRVTLAGDGALVAEDLRVRVSRSGIERIEIAELRARVVWTPDNRLTVPGAPVSSGEALPLDLLPSEGLVLERAQIVGETPAGPVELQLTAVGARHTPAGARLQGEYSASSPGGGDAFDLDLGGDAVVDVDAAGGWQTTLRVDAGRVAAARARATALTGELSARMPAGEPPSLHLQIAAGEVRMGDASPGRIELTAAWENGAGHLRVTSRALGLPAEAFALPGAAFGVPGAQTGVAGADADLPGAAMRASFELDAQVAAVPGGLHLTLREAVAELESDQGPESLVVSLGPNGDRPPFLDVMLDDRVARFGGRVEARAADARVETAVDAALSVQQASRAGATAGARAGTGTGATAGARAGAGAGAGAGGGWAMTAALTGVVAENLRWADMTVGLTADGTVRRDGEGWGIDGAGTLRGGGRWADVRVENLAADWAGAIESSDGGLRVVVSECIEWAFDALEIGALRIAGVTPPCLNGGEGGLLLKHDRANGRTDYAFAIDSAPFAARVSVAGEAWAVEGTWPQLDLGGEQSARQAWRVVADFSGGAARFSGDRASRSALEVAADGIDGTIDWRNGSLAPSTLRIATLRSLASPAWIAPVAVDARAQSADHGVAFEASLSDALGSFVVDVSGRHGDAGSHADLWLYPLRLVPGAIEVAEVSPRLAEYVDDVAGLVEFEGRIESVRGGEGRGGEGRGGEGLAVDEAAAGSSAAAGRLVAEGTLKLDDLSFTVAGVPIEGLRAQTHFASLVPPSTGPEQTLTIDRIDLGVPLEDGVVQFALATDGQLDVSRVDFAFAGGRLFAEPFTVDSADLGDIGLVLRAEDVELAAFLASSRIEGLDGSGTLAGRVPVRLTDGRVRLDDGVLSAETDGVLRYTPDDLPDFLRGDDVRSRMLREVLTNFHYDELSLAVSGQSGEGGQQRLTLNASGSNPDFLDGHPIELGFNFTGPLLGAVRSAVDLSGAEVSELPELSERFEQQNSDHEEGSR